MGVGCAPEVSGVGKSVPLILLASGSGSRILPRGRILRSLWLLLKRGSSGKRPDGFSSEGGAVSSSVEGD